MKLVARRLANPPHHRRHGASCCPRRTPAASSSSSGLSGWVERHGEWEWEEDDPNYVAPPVTATLAPEEEASSNATPKLPAGTYKPKQSLGQNYLKDPNTVQKILRAFHDDAFLSHHHPNDNDDDDDEANE